jgi:hypothetical protein
VLAEEPPRSRDSGAVRSTGRLRSRLGRDVAHALVRAVFALFGTQASGIDHSVHTSVNAARMSACATRLHCLWWASRPRELTQTPKLLSEPRP